MYTRVIDKDVYYVDQVSSQKKFNRILNEKGWYLELSFSDGGYDIFGPYNSKEEASGVF